MKKQIIKIDEEKCTGCGVCASTCQQSAIKIIDGKAKLVNASSCDGIGACIGQCPFDAITFETPEEDKPLPCGCPGTMMKDFRAKAPAEEATATKAGAVASELRQWPIQLALVNPKAPYFKDADLVIAADCVAFSFGDFHRRFLKGKTLVVFCPKLDSDLEAYVEKLTSILKENNIKSVTLLHMEVPCCGGLVRIVEEALKASGKNVIVKDYTISLQGEII